MQTQLKYMSLLAFIFVTTGDYNHDSRLSISKKLVDISVFYQEPNSLLYCVISIDNGDDD